MTDESSFTYLLDLLTVRNAKCARIPPPRPYAPPYKSAAEVDVGFDRLWLWNGTNGVQRTHFTLPYAATGTFYSVAIDDARCFVGTTTGHVWTVRTRGLQEGASLRAIVGWPKCEPFHRNPPNPQDPCGRAVGH